MPGRSDQPGRTGLAKPTGTPTGPYPGTVPDLPRAVRFVTWFNAWQQGATSLDDAHDAIRAGDAAHHVTGLDADGAPISLILALGRLAKQGAGSALLALPAPGDPLGLGGPAVFNGEAIDAGEAVLLPGAGWGLIPTAAGRGVVWHAHDARAPREHPDLAEADRVLRTSLLESARELADLDVASWKPAAADALLSVRSPSRLDHWAPGYPATALAVAATALRCRSIVDLALDDDGGALTAEQAARRRNALVPLDRAARRGLVAACSTSRPG
jgi:hypothetical protein